jgi:RecB family exonuclease
MSKLAGELIYLPLGPIRRVSPSRFSDFQLCSLKEIWSSNHQIPLLPLHPSIRLGTISHAVLEAAAKGAVTDKASFDARWDDMTRKVQQEMLQHPIEKHLVPLESSAFNYEVKKILSFKLAEQMFISTDSGISEKQSAEQWFESADGKIGGQIDLVLSYEDGVEIVDYKTGNVLDSGSGMEVKEEYKVQMKLYAGLYHEVNGFWPVKLSIIGIDRQKYDISFCQEECWDLLDNARKIVDETNELIEAGLKPEDFANPSPALCKYCSYRPACKKYWQARECSDKWPIDVLGEAIEKKVLGNGFYRMSISNNGSLCVIRGLSAERHEFLKKEISGVLFCDLGKDVSDGSYIEQLLTTGYALRNENKQRKD